MARNSNCIDTRTLFNAINGLGFSEREGRPLTAFATISWQNTEGFSADLLPHRQGSMFKELSRWLRRRNVVPTFIWVIENSRRMGLHTHLGIYAPPPVFPFLQSKFQRFIQGFLEGERILQIHTDQGDERPKLYWTPRQRAGSFRYMLKGMDHRATCDVDGTTANLGDAIGIEHRGQQGMVAWKRVGISHSLGPISRLRAGYVDVTSPTDLRAILYPPPRAQAAAAEGAVA